MLPLQGLGGATTGLLIVIERRINDLGKEFRNCPAPPRFMFIGPIERLAMRRDVRSAKQQKRRSLIRSLDFANGQYR
jgi:hypothetical protein